MTAGKIFKDKRLMQTILLGVIALILLFACYFIFFAGEKSDEASAVTDNAVTMTETESKLCFTLSQIDGVGNVTAYVNEDESGRATGAILVFEGADDLSVRMDVLRATALALRTACGTSGVEMRSVAEKATLRPSTAEKLLAAAPGALSRAIAISRCGTRAFRATARLAGAAPSAAA